MKFYQNQGVLDELVSKAPKCFEESVILTNEEHQSVLNVGCLYKFRDGL